MNGKEQSLKRSLTEGNRALRTGRPFGLLAASASLAALVACSAGSSSPPHNAVGSAAEPSLAPAVTTTPAGRIVALPAKSAPEGLAVDPITHLVVVALRTRDRVALVDERTLSVRYLPTHGRARHLTLAKPGGPVLLPGEDTNELLQIALPSGKTVSRTKLPSQPHNAAVIDGNYWVDDELAGSVSVVSPSGKILATLHGPVQPGGVAAAGGRVGVTDVRGNRMYFYDEKTYQAQGSIALGSGPTHDAFLGGNQVVVADTTGSALLVVNMTAKKISSRLALPGAPYGLVVDAASGQLWVTLTATNQLVHVFVIDGKLTVVGRVATVQQPNTVGLDPTTKCLYVAGVAHAQLQVVCPTDPT